MSTAPLKLAATPCSSPLLPSPSSSVRVAPSGDVTVDIDACPRCAEDHAALTFTRMAAPFDAGHPFWAPCPSGRGPLILCAIDRKGTR